jgi:hypothetical protein
MPRNLSIFLAGCCSPGCSVSMAQTPTAGPVASADVYIDTVVGTATKDSFTCAVNVNNHNDDDSQGTTLIILLPLQVDKIPIHIKKNFPGKCTPTANGPYVGYVTCGLGSLGTSQPDQIVEITTSPSTALPGYSETCSAFIYSAVGDIEKRNNYCYWPPDADQPQCPFHKVRVP